MAVSNALTTIQKGQEQTRFDNLQIGDIVGYDVIDTSDGKGKTQIGIVYKKTLNDYFYNGPTITLLVEVDHHGAGRYVTSMIMSPLHVVKLNTFVLSKEHLDWAKRIVTLGNAGDGYPIDNLTYIEILARLREY